LTLGALAAAAASSSTASDVEPGVLGFLVVVGIGVALVFLLRSMNKQFRKITPEPGPDAGDDPLDDEEPGSVRSGGAHSDGARSDGTRSDSAPAK
jgi:hypothetical protein